MTVWTLKDFASGKTTQKTQKTRPKEKGQAVVVDSWPANDPPPKDSNDAQAWGEWRLRRGIAG